MSPSCHAIPAKPSFRRITRSPTRQASQEACLPPSRRRSGFICGMSLGACRQRAARLLLAPGITTPASGHRAIRSAGMPARSPRPADAWQSDDVQGAHVARPAPNPADAAPSGHDALSPDRSNPPRRARSARASRQARVGSPADSPVTLRGLARQRFDSPDALRRPPPARPVPPRRPPCCVDRQARFPQLELEQGNPYEYAVQPEQPDPPYR